MKILVIAPHPDDEVLGCGGTIAKHVNNGDIVDLCIVTQPYAPEWSESYIKNKKKEIEKSKNILGIREIHFLDLPTVKLDGLLQKDINTALYGIVKETTPDVVYIPHKGDLNRDHRIVFECALVALRPIGCGVKKILSYEILSETEWGQPIEPFFPNFYVDISKTISEKCNAMEAYSSELKSEPHPRSLKIIRANAKKRGSEVGVSYAESFILIREVDLS